MEKGWYRHCGKRSNAKVNLCYDVYAPLSAYPVPPLLRFLTWWISSSCAFLSTTVSWFAFTCSLINCTIPLNGTIIQVKICQPQAQPPLDCICHVKLWFGFIYVFTIEIILSILVHIEVGEVSINISNWVLFVCLMQNANGGFSSQISPKNWCKWSSVHCAEVKDLLHYLFLYPPVDALKLTSQYVWIGLFFAGCQCLYGCTGPNNWFPLWFSN